MGLAIMEERWGRFKWGLLGLLVLSALLRLYRIDAPVVDGFFDKQVAIANRARAMAGPPFSLLSAAFDFLPEDGRRMPCNEEIPLYHGLVALGYRLLGEQDWFARAINLVGSLVAIAAFCGLVRREYDAQFALVAGVLFASCPLLIFYGRAVAVDTWMLAGILLAVYCYGRYQDENRLAWLIASGLGALLAAGFKYWGIVALLPIADLAYRRHGLRAAVHYEFWLPAAIVAVPLAWWMFGVFLAGTNPAGHCTYFVFQRPEALGKLLHRFVDRLLWKSCGPVLVGLIAVGGYAVARFRVGTKCLWRWTGVGLFYYLLLAPAAVGHEYYDLVLLPACALWGATGWTWLCHRAATGQPSAPLSLRMGVVLLLLAVVVHSPWIMHGRFRENRGMLVAGDRVQQLCPNGRRIVAGPLTPQPIVHYARREGWLWHEHRFPDWQQRLSHYRRLGAEYVVLYFDRRTGRRERDAYAPLLSALPVVEHRAEPDSSDAIAYEYYILRLSGVDLQDSPHATAAAQGASLR